MNPKLTIVTLSLVERRLRRRILFKHLHAQIEAAGGPSVVEHLVYEDHGEMPNGVKLRNAYREAQGDYICCVDDDDFVSDTYVADILKAIATNPDVVTFRLSHEFKRQTWHFHPGAVDEAHNQPGGYVMSANHLCAWNAEIAKRIPWLPMWYGTDQLWYQLLNASMDRSYTEFYIPKILYHYVYSPALTSAQQIDKVDRSKSLYAGGVDGWRHKETGFIVSSLVGRNGPPDSRKLGMCSDGTLLTINEPDFIHLGTSYVR